MNFYVVVLRLFLHACLAITTSSCMLNSDVMVIVYHYTVFIQCAKSLLGRCLR